METGNLNIEKIPTDENHYHSPSDYGYHKAKKEGLEPDRLYEIPSIGGYTSWWYWLPKNKERGVRVVFGPGETGALSVWERPKEKRERYVIGAIGAIDSENKPSAAIVLNVQTLTQAAELSISLAPDLFAIELLKLCVWYNLALIAVDNSEQRHGLSVLTALMNGNPQYDALRLGSCSLIYQDQAINKVKNERPNKLGIEMTNERKRLIFDNLFSALRENKINLYSEKFIKELQIPTVIDEGYKTDWANRAYALVICYEMARLYPYKKPPDEPKELPDCDISNM